MNESVGGLAKDDLQRWEMVTAMEGPFELFFLGFRRCRAPVFGLLAGLLCGWQGLYASSVMAEGGIRSNKSSFDFGVVREGERVRHTFLLVNESDRPLRISRVIPGCGCMSVAQTRGPIPPSGSLPLEVVFVTDGFSGPISSSIRVFVEDPEKPYLDITLRGEVRPYFAVVPDRVLFADVVQFRGSEVQQVVVKKAPGQQVTVRSLSPAVTAEVKGDGGGELRLEVRIAPNAPVGELRERIVLRESGKGGRAFSIPVFAVVKSALQVSRSTIVLKAGGSESEDQNSVYLNYGGERPFGTPRFVFSRGVDGVLVQTSEIDPGRTWKLSFSTSGQKAASSVDERVTILGDDDEGPSASMRIVASKLD